VHSVPLKPKTADTQRAKESPRRAGAFKEKFMRISRDQGALDAPILSQSMNQARRGSHKRHGPPVYLRKEGRGERCESHSIAIPPSCSACAACVSNSSKATFAHVADTSPFAVELAADLRLYGATEAAIDKNWKPGDIEKVN
jgi:hypothetical protein